MKGTYNMVHYFIKATGEKGTVINIVSLGASFLAPGYLRTRRASWPPSNWANVSILVSLTLKISMCDAEYLTLREEHPNLRVFSIHPSIVEAEGGRGMAVPHFARFAKDKRLLTDGVTLYRQKPEADHLRGVFLSVNWDVAELDEHKGEIVDKKAVEALLSNATLSPCGYAWSEVGQ